MKISVEDLLFLPRTSRLWGYMPMPGHGTTILLPDGESSGTITSVTDERWKHWGSKTIEVNMLLMGPAVSLNIRELMDLFRHHMGGGGWCTLAGGGVQASLRADSELTLLRAMPHSCGADPGRPCAIRWGGNGRSICDAADTAPVAFEAVAA